MHLSAATDKSVSSLRDRGTFRSTLAGSHHVTWTSIDATLCVVGRAADFLPQVLSGEGDVQELAKGLQALRWSYRGDRFPASDALPMSAAGLAPRAKDFRDAAGGAQTASLPKLPSLRAAVAGWEQRHAATSAAAQQRRLQAEGPEVVLPREVTGLGPAPEPQKGGEGGGGKKSKQPPARERSLQRSVPRHLNQTRATQETEPGITHVINADNRGHPVWDRNARSWRRGTSFTALQPNNPDSFVKRANVCRPKPLRLQNPNHRRCDPQPYPCNTPRQVPRQPPRPPPPLPPPSGGTGGGGPPHHSSTPPSPVTRPA